MKKRIAVSEVRLGMHLEELEGAWIEHPFWKTRFVLRETADLEKLKSSKLTGVWIDTAKGLDVALAEPDEPLVRLNVEPVERVQPSQAVHTAPALQGPKLLQQAKGLRTPASTAKTPFGEELAKAAAVCKRGSAQVKSMFAEARMGKAVDAEACMPLVTDITDSVFRNPGALVSLARLKTQDDYTYMHSVAVCALMVALARELQMELEDCRIAGMAGLLHDMGKAVMPPELLNRPGKLSEEEFAIIRTHPQCGHDLLIDGKGVSVPVLQVALHHHEKVDGSGYPHGLTGATMSLLARMGAVCDVYDAITSNRSYKQAWDPGESIARMASWKGHFDPEVLQGFIRSLGIYPTGSLVRMKSDHLGVVVDQNTGNLTKPVVKIMYSLKSQLPLTPRKVDLTSSLDSIVARETPEKWGFGSLDHLWAGEAAMQRR
jgi:HD-GYP domain-containing protein (c-di-GMP phosphodiesterase class II)